MRRIYMKLSIVFIIFLSMFLAGCASGPVFSPVTSIPTGKALVYMYRTSSFVGSANSYKIWINDIHVTDMGNGGYYPYLADPGELTFKMKVITDILHFGGAHFLLEKEKPVLKIHVEAGKTYYVKHEWDSQATISNLAVMVLVDEETGSREIVKCKKAKGYEN
ncbi:MAG: DUF2846 domain-containing protein [Sedimentisphaerales bacterium]|nr:DUF2846 domain-containing protein [Sedimentisphaerales bacterium]